MRVGSIAIAICLTATVGSVVAEPLSEDEMHVIKPEGMNDTAVFRPGRIPWCAATYSGENWNKGRLRRGIQSRISTAGAWMDAVQVICQWADDPTWQRQAAYIIQEVMNAKNISQEEAVETIKRWIAAAQAEKEREGREPTDEERFAFSERHLSPVAPAPGVDAAKVTGAPAWCDKAGPIKSRWDTRQISNSAEAQWGINGVVEAALHLCQRPNDPTWKIKAGHVLQRWMNWTKQTQSAAEASLRARIQIDKLKSERDALCASLEVSPELGGRAKAYALAHQRFFGCHERDGGELWRDSSIPWSDKVGFYFDADPALESELIRLYWLFLKTSNPTDALPSKHASENRVLLNYAVASIDFGKIDEKALGQQLAAAPFNNDFARAVVSESLALLKWRRKMFDQIIDKLAKNDATYHEILRAAPRRGFEEWQKLSAPWKAELDRSNEFENKLSQPSRKALAGCATVLHQDAAKLIKSYKSNDYNDLVTKIAGDPVASLLLSRLAVCYAAEKVQGSGVFRDLVAKGRDLRGPRSLAYYTVVDAITEALEDRPRLLVDLSSFDLSTGTLAGHYAQEFEFKGFMPLNLEKDGQHGVIKAVKKVPEGVRVEFKKQVVSYPGYDCVSTNRPVRIASDGRIEYYRNCKQNGKSIRQDETPSPLVIPQEMAGVLKPGVYVFSSYGVVVYTKKKPADSKIQSFFGFAL